MRRIRVVKQEGFILVLTLLCALILTSVMLSTMFVSSKGQKLAKNFKESVQTLNAADASVKQAKGAINSWLQTQQVGTGNIVKFSAILAASNSNGMVIPGNSTNWGNLSQFGNTIKVTVSNDAADPSATVDTNRIIVITAEATSATRQRVRVKAFVQAPDNTNSTGVPTLLAAATFCSDQLGRKQVARVLEASYFTSLNHPTLPAWNCTDSSCVQDGSSESGGSTYNLPAAIMFNATQQSTQISPDSTVRSKGFQITTDPTNCNQLTSFASQIGNLSDSLPNVNIIKTVATGGDILGTRTSPTISIINGVNSVNKRKGVTRNKVSFEPNTKGSGIMLVQYTSDSSNRFHVAGEKNFYYEGLVMVQGDEYATWRLNYGSTLYGAVTMFSGSDDSVLMERTALRNQSNWIFSTAAINQANLALGSAGTSSPITLASDPRNSTVTIGWYEDYNF